MRFENSRIKSRIFPIKQAHGKGRPSDLAQVA